MSSEDKIFLGYVKKTHGVAGELLVRSEISDLCFKKSWGTVFIDIDTIQVPFFIETYKQPDKHSVILKIEDIDDKDTASGYLNKNVYVRKVDVERFISRAVRPDQTGYIIYDQSGKTIGSVIRHIEFAGNSLFLVDRGNDTCYLPASDEMIIGIDNARKQLTMQLPDGLIESQEQ